tara:strand:- start:54 stop:233 length:180 start_codon:yes stop_codon:yes gene_type:complete
MALGIKYFCDSYGFSNYNIYMIEIFQIFWSAPIELRIIILSALVAFPLLAYFGMKGTGL